MNKLIVICIIMSITILTSCSRINTISRGHKAQMKLLPAQFSKLYLGMPLDRFSKIKNLNKLTRSTIMSFRDVYEETPHDKHIKEVTYYFDKDNNMPLYELIIEYKPDFDLASFITDKYGSPNSGEEWLFDSGEGFKIRIWTFDKKLVIAGLIKDTEWTE